MEQITAPTARQLRACGGSIERYYEVERARIAAEDEARAHSATPEGQLEAKLLDVGGNLWEKDGKRRVYFNGVFLSDSRAFVTGYYDVRANQWVVDSASPEMTAEQFGAEMTAKADAAK